MSEIRAAERRLNDFLRMDYPPDAYIAWEVGERRFSGNVVMNSYGDRIKVRNARTNKARFISASQIVS